MDAERTVRPAAEAARVDGPAPEAGSTAEPEPRNDSEPAMRRQARTVHDGREIGRRGDGHDGRAALAAVPIGRTDREAARGPDRPLRIGLVAPPLVPVPPPRYGGTERVVAALAAELERRGHQVTVFAAGDSRPAGRLVPVLPASVWSTGYRGDVAAHFIRTAAIAWSRAEEFDILHSHIEVHGFLLARHAPRPVLTTLHGRLDVAGIPELLEAFPEIPLVSISDSQRRWAPRANWVATVHHGLPLETIPFEDRPGGELLFVGRIAPEKGVAEVIELARRTGRRVRMAAKAYDPAEVELFERLVRPAIESGLVVYEGELGEAARNELYRRALATLMLGAWPEPFGLVAIESLAAGTPVIARRAGALPEIVEHGVDGFLVDDVEEAILAVRLVGGLDRTRIRARALERFSVARMTDAYEAIYRRLIADWAARRHEARIPSGEAWAPAPTVAPLGASTPGRVA
jgi:glycosyltransferase involved in cell wall biosynthesis